MLHFPPGLPCTPRPQGLYSKGRRLPPALLGTGKNACRYLQASPPALRAQAQGLHLLIAFNRQASGLPIEYRSFDRYSPQGRQECLPYLQAGKTCALFPCPRYRQHLAGPVAARMAALHPPCTSPLLFRAPPTPAKKS